MHKVLERQLRRVGVGEGPPTAEQWQALLERIDRAYAEADKDRYTLERSLELSSTEMRKRYTELQEAQRKLVEASRKAGMADVAASVLHNVGNVLNSANTSANLVVQTVRSPSCAGLGKVLALLAAQPSPGEFLDKDPKGKKVIPYLETLKVTMEEERRSLVTEVESLQKNLEHIKQVVAQQLSSAKGRPTSELSERVELSELFQDAIHVAKTGRDGGAGEISFVRELAAPSIETDRHKLMQIVTNLLANARDAVAGRPDATVTIRTSFREADMIVIDVADNGVGIPAATLERLFSHGFTTKPDGHGYGLHGSACAAIELGGKLGAFSDGPGCGATFRLTLPRSRGRRAPTRVPSAAPHATEAT